MQSASTSAAATAIAAAAAAAGARARAAAAAAASAATITTTAAAAAAADAATTATQHHQHTHNHHHRATVLSYYRQLLRLTRRLPDAQQRASARAEAAQTLRARAGVADPQQAADHAKELAARVAFLRMTTPRPPGEPLEGGRFVYRGGQWEQGEGETKGARVADGSIDMAEAKARNAAHYERFYGKPMPKKMFF